MATSSGGLVAQWVDIFDISRGGFFAFLDNIGILLFRLSFEGLFENWVPSSQGQHKYEFQGVVCDIEDISPRVVPIPLQMYTLNARKTVCTMKSSIVEYYLTACPDLDTDVVSYLRSVDTFYSTSASGPGSASFAEMHMQSSNHNRNKLSKAAASAQHSSKRHRDNVKQLPVPVESSSSPGHPTVAKKSAPKQAAAASKKDDLSTNQIRNSSTGYLDREASKSSSTCATADSNNHSSHLMQYHDVLKASPFTSLSADAAVLIHRHPDIAELYTSSVRNVGFVYDSSTGIADGLPDTQPGHVWRYRPQTSNLNLSDGGSSTLFPLLNNGFSNIESVVPLRKPARAELRAGASTKSQLSEHSPGAYGRVGDLLSDLDAGTFIIHEAATNNGDILLAKISFVEDGAAFVLVSPYAEVGPDEFR
jgi:hypothetical protein